MNTDLIDFFNITLRFTHIVAAIMWIGNSLLFTWMEINLLKRDDDKNLIGYMDMLHGGGVFHLQKRVLKPDTVPSPLHWFYWQSYTTWLSGFFLLVTYFFTRADTLMLDPSKMDLGSGGAISISLAGIFGGWLLFDLYWRSPLKNYLKTGAAVWISLVILYAIGLNTVFNGRAMFLQVGMTLGSFMTANVFFHIIPNQRKFMKALAEGKEHNLNVGKAAKFRSLSNHYITFPVIFLMLSGHYPVLYGSDNKIVILTIVIVSLIVIKHMMNVRNTFKPWLAVLLLTFGGACSGIVAAITLPSSSSKDPVDPQVAAGEEAFNSLGCIACHQAADTSIAPGLAGIFGKERELLDGSKVVADEAYLRESILQSTAKVSKGFVPAMPVYEGVISDPQVDQLIAYLKQF
ncbi:urate hydroxylase PuuD [Pelagicoccus sp. SDUM812002]|uniref:urate hydroxylase PuuD n=1 Tax=Pelagicoccus sp. SDUM812002 TaxID=3041266 RepID=UPI00280D789E|nr:urate hydroxylase PuuD [Pelagicoccus sp. SDUM812002]MDQ8187762.1 urate hydroxylase PuuD [Pelagicoccus sp. SDUM812002]